MNLGLMRVKNEQRLIWRSISSFMSLCDEVYVLDDNSEDDTAAICRSIPGVTVFPSPFEGLNESRDKEWLLSKALPLNPEWICFWDGDEILAPGYQESLRAAMRKTHGCISLRILYLWNSWDTVRIDGVYGDFHRESIFRPNGSRFETRGTGANFHCGNVPWGNRINKRVMEIPLLHAGYMHRSDRERKFAWYNQQDPNNASEDHYRHMVIGDLYPAESRYRHGGPLKLAPLSEFTSTKSGAAYAAN
jgi:glycosyltransferase involved in cell wall biosynthesis